MGNSEVVSQARLYNMQISVTQLLIKQRKGQFQTWQLSAAWGRYFEISPRTRLESGHLPWDLYGPHCFCGNVPRSQVSAECNG